MTDHPITRTLIAALLLSSAGFAQMASAQNPPAAPCSAPTTPPAQTQDQTTKQEATKPCQLTPAAKKPSTAEQFPFPGEPAKPATAPSSPDSPKPATTPSEAGSEHPFPTQPPPKLPGDDSSSSSSSSGDAPDIPPDDPAAKGDPSNPSNPPEGTSVHRRLPKVKRVQTDDERVDEDLRVSKFYLNDENYQGAYLRAKDAVTTQPDYSATHFALAEVAEKMKKKDEAIAEYQAYLKLDPDGEKSKAAKKALAGLQ